MKNTNLIWLDLEMTGLDSDYNTIIEIATIITDVELNIIAEGPVYAIYHDDTELAKMDGWNKKQHNSSGLIKRVKTSKTNMQQAELGSLSFIKQHVALGVSPLCGNSVCTDKIFLYRYMPNLLKYFHYRLIDVSSIKELAKRWAPELEYNKNNTHLALDDIKESIEELKYYKKHFINYNILNESPRN